jgi:hypothetical protein
MNGLTSWKGLPEADTPKRSVDLPTKFLPAPMHNHTSPFPFSLIYWHTKRYQITLRASKKYVRSVELFTDTNTGNLDFVVTPYYTRTTGLTTHHPPRRHKIQKI